MKKIGSTIFVALLVAGASSVQAQDVKKENTSTKATTKVVKSDIKKVDVAKEVDATMVNPDGTLKEVKATALPKTENKKTKLEAVDPADAAKKQ